jgi:hypothetical protein
LNDRFTSGCVVVAFVAVDGAGSFSFGTGNESVTVARGCK